MKVMIAIDSFKGSLSSTEVSDAISVGIKNVYQDAEVISFPMADGGEGTVEALVHATNGKFVHVEVTGPLGGNESAKYGILGDEKTAVIEVASACGLPLIESSARNPLKATTYGVGELILHAINEGCREFIIGLGGSATNDAGVGMLQALGFQFKDAKGHEIGVGSLEKIAHIDEDKAHPLLKHCTFKLACDVTNYLYGKEGAAYVFGRQKGASQADIIKLDKGLRHFATVVKEVLNVDVHRVQGSGAAGGLGAAFFAFLDAELKSGIEVVLNKINFEDYLEHTDVIITGEGKLDAQTEMGKVPSGISKIAKKYNIPVIALAGAVPKESCKLNELGISAYFSILNEPMSMMEAMDPKNTYDNIRMTTIQLFQMIQAFNMHSCHAFGGVLKGN